MRITVLIVIIVVAIQQIMITSIESRLSKIRESELEGYARNGKPATILIYEADDEQKK